MEGQHLEHLGKTLGNANGLPESLQHPARLFAEKAQTSVAF
jgi:hypothetical protein